MLQPKRTKYRRPQKGRCKGNAQRGNQLAFGSFGIKSLDTHWLTGRQIEAARIAMTRYMQREGQSWIRIFPDKPITKRLIMKIAEIRKIAANELQERLDAEVEKYNQMLLNHSVSPLENPAQIKEARRTIAKIKTVLRENELNNK